MVDTQVVAAVEEQRGTVASVEFDEIGAADDMARVVRNRNDEVENHILGQQVEEVATVDESRKALLDGPKERIKSAEVAHILDHSPPLRMVDSRQFWTVSLIVVIGRCLPRVLELARVAAIIAGLPRDTFLRNGPPRSALLQYQWAAQASPTNCAKGPVQDRCQQPANRCARPRSVRFGLSGLRRGRRSQPLVVED